MNIQQLVKNIEILSSQKGVNKTKALQECGAGKNFISNALSGSEPSIGKIEQIADYFGVSIDYLLGNEPIKSNITEVIPASQIYQIPVFATVSAGFGAYAAEDIVDYMPIVLTNPHDAPDMLGIRVHGNSMYPKIEDGDTVIVRKQSSVDSGDIAVIMIDGEEGVVKKVVYGETWVELHSINPEYMVRRFEGADLQRLRVVGLVKGVFKSF